MADFSPRSSSCLLLQYLVIDILANSLLDLVLLFDVEHEVGAIDVFQALVVCHPSAVEYSPFLAVNH